LLSPSVDFFEGINT